MVSLRVEAFVDRHHRKVGEKNGASSGRLARTSNEDQVGFLQSEKEAYPFEFRTCQETHSLHRIYCRA